MRVQCESNRTPHPPKYSDIFSPNGWEFLVKILRAYYTFLSTLDYNFFYSIICNFYELMSRLIY